MSSKSTELPRISVSSTVQSHASRSASESGMMKDSILCSRPYYCENEPLESTFYDDCSNQFCRYARAKKSGTLFEQEDSISVYRDERMSIPASSNTGHGRIHPAKSTRRLTSQQSTVFPVMSSLTLGPPDSCHKFCALRRSSSPQISTPKVFTTSADPNSALLRVSSLPIVGTKLIDADSSRESRGFTTTTDVNEPMQSVDIQFVFNTIADNMAGHVLVDTRCDVSFDAEHAGGAVDIEEALTYAGRHFLIMSEIGEAGCREWEVWSRLERSRRALSISMVAGGFLAFQERYAFLCEPTAATLEEERLRHRNRVSRHLPSQVLDGLFLGGLGCAEDVNSLNMLGITHVVTAMADPTRVRVPPGLLWLRLAVRDEVDEDLAAHFGKAVSFVGSALRTSNCQVAGRGMRDRGKVLVHCKMGKSRSAAIVAAYLIWGAGMSLHAAHQHLRHCRRQVSINAGFMRQLMDYEHHVRGSSSLAWDPRSGVFVVGD